MAEARPARPQPRVEPGSMKLRDLLRVVSGSGLEDWTILFRPTFRHRVVETLRPDGRRDRLVVDEQAVAFGSRPNLAIGLAYGMVAQGAYALPAGPPSTNENARPKSEETRVGTQRVRRDSTWGTP